MSTTWQRRVDAVDWDAATDEVNAVGGALLPRLITENEAARLRGLYSDDGLFRFALGLVFHDAA